MEKHIGDLYKSIGTIKGVAKKLNIHEKTAAKRLRDAGVSITGRGYVSSKASKNDVVGKNKQADDYYLGLIAGDGCLVKNKTGVLLTTTDEELAINYEKYLGEGTTRLTKIFDSKKTVFTVKISSLSYRTWLETEGLSVAKSTTLKLNHLNWDIVRGLFDADGSYSQRQFKITTGSLDMAEMLETFFISEGFKTVSRKKGNALDVYVLVGKKCELLPKLYFSLYPNTCDCLTRKKEAIRSHLQQCK